MTRVLVLGAGVSGQAAARLADRRGMSVTVYDRSPGSDVMASGFAVAAGEWDDGLLRGIDLVVASPGFSERSEPIVDALEAGRRIVSEIELAYQTLSSPIAAITGTNGKTSVTEATSAMLEASGLEAPATGNIGAPLSDFTTRAYDALVVEVSSFQLRFIEDFHPRAAAITNVALDHLDWHGSEWSYRSAKARIYENQTSSDLLVFDIDDPGATELAGRAPSRKVPVSGVRLPEGGAGPDGEVLRVNDLEIGLDELVSRDPVHISNVATAGLLALELGATPEGVGKGALQFRPGRHRRELVASTAGVDWIDDSKATNPHAALASIRSHRSVVLIAGGLAKGVDIRPLATEPAVRLVIGIGEAGPSLVEAAGERGRLAGTLEVAVEMAARAATPGDTVLLAPGCASFDQFESYGARGERFTELVNERAGASRK